MIVPRLITREFASRSSSRTSVRQSGVVPGGADVRGFGISLPITINTGAPIFSGIIDACNFDRFTVHVTDNSGVSRLDVLWQAVSPLTLLPFLGGLGGVLLGTTTAQNTILTVSFIPGTHGTLGLGSVGFRAVGASTVLTAVSDLILES
jgi:hypothetical protein